MDYYCDCEEECQCDEDELEELSEEQIEAYFDVDTCPGDGRHGYNECPACDAAIEAAFLCLDCSLDTVDSNYYMVHSQLWLSVAPDKGMLCIPCLEKRIGRQLTKDDFTECLLNEENAQNPDLGLLYQRLNA